VGIDLREKWEDDPLSRYTHDPSWYKNLRRTKWIFIKSGMDIMPLDTTPNSYFLVFCNQHYQRDGGATFWSGRMMKGIPPWWCHHPYA
jgi:hypothetical protein